MRPTESEFIGWAVKRQFTARTAIHRLLSPTGRATLSRAAGRL